MDLALNFLLVLLIEIPLVGFFFRRRNRKKAYMAAFLINIATWPLLNIIILNTTWFDKEKLFNPLVQIPMIMVEAVFYYFYMKMSLKKALLIAFFANLVSNTANHFIKVPPSFYQKRSNQIIR